MESTKKEITIIVNAKEKTWTKDDISFVQVIELAYGEYVENPNIVYTVAYSKGHSDQNGTLKLGEKVKAKNKMVFNVSKTDKS